MKRIVSLLWCAVLVLSHFSAAAQYDNEPVTYEMPDRINAIGVNLTPGVLFLMNGDPIRAHFGIMYKRQTQPNKKWRFQLGYEMVDRLRDERQNLPLEWSDTTITFNHVTRDHFRTDFRMGMEFFKPNRTFTMVYGFDGFIGFERFTEDQRSNPFYLDPQLDAYVPSPFIAPETTSLTVDYTYIGADFSIGQKITVRKHLNFILQWTPELRYRWPIAESFSDPQLRANAPSNDLTFDFRGIELFVNVVF